MKTLKRIEDWLDAKVWPGWTRAGWLLVLLSCGSAINIAIIYFFKLYKS